MEDERPVQPISAADPAKEDILHSLQLLAMKTHTVAMTAVFTAGFDALALIYYVLQSPRLATRQYVTQDGDTRLTITEPIIQAMPQFTVLIAALIITAVVALVLSAATAASQPRGLRTVPGAPQSRLVRNAELAHLLAFWLLVIGLFCSSIALVMIVYAEYSNAQLLSAS